MTVITAACIVAHPDDETIWMGGTILQKSEWKWTIFSLCRANDKDRMPKFKEACEIYRAGAVISDLDDEVFAPLEIEKVEEKIIDNLPDRNYDYIFTHGRNGEYGHIRHKEIHLAVKNLVRKKMIKCRKLFFFFYEMRGGNKIPAPSEKAQLFTFLSDSDFEKKAFLINKIYGFLPVSFEVKSCGKKEAFVEL